MAETKKCAHPSCHCKITDGNTAAPSVRARPERRILSASAATPRARISLLLLRPTYCPCGRLAGGMIPFIRKYSTICP